MPTVKKTNRCRLLAFNTTCDYEAEGHAILQAPDFSVIECFVITVDVPLFKPLKPYEEYNFVISLFQMGSTKKADVKQFLVKKLDKNWTHYRVVGRVESVNEKTHGCIINCGFRVYCIMDDVKKGDWIDVEGRLDAEIPK